MTLSLHAIRQLTVVTLFMSLAFGVFRNGTNPTSFGEETIAASLPEAVPSPRPHLPSIERVESYPVPRPIPKRVVPPKEVIPAPVGPIHAYPAYGLDPTTLIGETHITAVYFVPKDQVPGQYADWQENLTATMEAIKGYMAREFQNRLTISYAVHPTVLVGNHALTNYGELDGAKVSLRQEVEEKIGWSEIKNRERATGRFPVLLIYYHTGFEDRYQAPDVRLGGAYALLQTALLPAFHLTHEMIIGSHQAGLITSGHEFSHLLGIPHPWEMGLEDSPGNLMGYQAHGQLIDTHIADQVKEAMGP